MPDFNIDGFVSNFKEGARAYLFYIKITNPAGGDTDKNTYLVTSSSMPESTIDQIETNWQGQAYSFGATQTFAEWTVSFRVDVKAKIHTELENWMKMVHDPSTNKHGMPGDYMQDQDIEMLDSQGTPIKKKKLIAAWPTSLSAITLDYTSKEVATFDCTFKYLRHE